MARLAHCSAVSPPSLGSVHATHMPCTRHAHATPLDSTAVLGATTRSNRLKPTPDQTTRPGPGDTLRLSQDNIICVTVASCLLLGHRSILGDLKVRTVTGSPGELGCRAAGHTLRPEPWVCPETVVLERGGWEGVCRCAWGQWSHPQGVSPLGRGEVWREER